jgi:hypothetical protein
MKKITFLVCSNGFGHYKRCARVANKLLEIDKNIIVDFISRQNTHKYQSDWIVSKKLNSNNRFNFIHGEATIEIDGINKNKQSINYNGISWLDNKMIEKSDLVISDNLASILEIRSDVILMGSFLWSELIFNDNHKELNDYANLELKLIKDIVPEMIALRDMVMPFVINHTKPFLTSWIVDFKYDLFVKTEINNILVLGGGTGYLDSDLADVCEILSSSEKYNIYTTNRISLLLSNNISYDIFGFTNDEFKKIDLIIGRPGIGTLTDCVAHGIPIFGVGESDNTEIQHNLKKITSLFFGLDISSEIKNINLLINNIQSDGSYQGFQKKLINTKKNGLTEITNFILNKLYEK